jgi:D-glycero-alpha-D-manno-heptose-7-phosphate kinase
MIVTRAPYRVSFFGGGSDLESFYSHSPGAVLSTTINKFTYISSHYFFDVDKIRVKYSKTETQDTVEEIEHPIVREVLRRFRTRGALEISSNGDVVAGSGLASSSAFTIALLLNMYVRSSRFVPKQQLAEEACDIEINRLKEPIGKQDQYACAYGGLNAIRFSTSGLVAVDPIHLDKQIYKDLQRNLLMFHTGLSRKTSSILAEQNDNMRDQKKTDIVRRMVDLVWIARESLYSGELRRFGELLHLSWQLKRQLASKISNGEIDSLYEKGLAVGAVGGKLLGAGGSGFLLFYCEPERQAELRAAMSPYRELLFKFENEGAKVIFVGDEYWGHDPETPSPS